MNYELIKLRSICYQGMWEVNDACTTGDIVELSDSPTSVDVIRELKRLGRIGNPCNNKVFNVDFDGNTICITQRKNGRYLYELRPVKE